jgi:surface antigen-like variable number repeat protein
MVIWVFRVMILSLLLVAVINVESISAQQNAEESLSTCAQSASVRNPLLREAIANQYTVRRVEFAGNETTRDYVVRRRVVLREGDIFTRTNLTKSLVGLNKLKIMYPVRLNDVIVRLDKTYNHIDVTFCLRERHPAAKRAS